MVKRTEISIFQVLLKAKEPITIYRMAKLIDLNPSSIYASINKLEKNQIVRKMDSGYILHPMFYDKTFWSNLSDRIMPAFELIKEYSDIEDISEIISIFFIIINILSEKYNR